MLSGMSSIERANPGTTLINRKINNKKVVTEKVAHRSTNLPPLLTKDKNYSRLEYKTLEKVLLDTEASLNAMVLFKESEDLREAFNELKRVNEQIGQLLLNDSSAQPDTGVDRLEKRNNLMNEIMNGYK